jgi:flagellar basal-body rod modification protein FlgD
MAVSGVKQNFNAGLADQQVESGGINDVNMDDFLKIMITELQNQDPLNPLENDELISQISQIRSVGATEKLTETLDSVLLGQNISSATNLIGAEVDAISDDNQRVTGTVDRVSVASGQPKLHLDLNPRASASAEAGAIEEGEYEYLVVWTQDNKLLGVDPLAGETGKKIGVDADGGAIQISNLPETKVAKHIYRRQVGEQDYSLVGSISEGKNATFLDTVSNEALSGQVLGGTPQMMEPSREFTVSLKNVGEIRPPRS